MSDFLATIKKYGVDIINIHDTLIDLCDQNENYIKKEKRVNSLIKIIKFLEQNKNIKILLINELKNNEFNNVIEINEIKNKIETIDKTIKYFNSEIDIVVNEFSIIKTQLNCHEENILNFFNKKIETFALLFLIEFLFLLKYYFDEVYNFDRSIDFSKDKYIEADLIIENIFIKICDLLPHLFISYDIKMIPKNFDFYNYDNDHKNKYRINKLVNNIFLGNIFKKEWSFPLIIYSLLAFISKIYKNDFKNYRQSDFFVNDNKIILDKDKQQHFLKENIIFIINNIFNFFL